MYSALAVVLGAFVQGQVVGPSPPPTVSPFSPVLQPMPLTPPAATLPTATPSTAPPSAATLPPPAATPVISAQLPTFFAIGPSTLEFATATSSFGASVAPATAVAAPATTTGPSFFVKDPMMRALLLSTLASEATSTSSGDLMNTLLIASLMGNNGGPSLQSSHASAQFAPIHSASQFGPSYVDQSQLQYFTPDPQPPQYFVPRDYPGHANNYNYVGNTDYTNYNAGDNYEVEDSFKKLVLLSGVTSGNVNPLAAVAMGNNQRMSGAEALFLSSLGNSPVVTLLAVKGGLSGSNSGSDLGGTNVLQTLLLADALAPPKEGESNSALDTLVMLSALRGSNGGGLLGNGDLVTLTNKLVSRLKQ